MPSPALIKSLRPTYAKVDLERLGSNIALARKLSGSDIMAVVKADAYGHGIKETATYAYKKQKVKTFAVATATEGFFLRKIIKDRSVNIIVLGYVDRLLFDDIFENGLTLNIFDDGIAKEFHNYLKSKKLTSPVSLKIDTGMGRLGFSPELKLDSFRKKYPRFEIVHIMSHFAVSDTDQEYTDRQEERFRTFLSSTTCDFDTSLYNSSAIALRKGSYSHVRPGIFMYGYVNGAEQVPVKPVMSVISKIVHVQKLKKGESVSYGRRFIADKPCTVAVVPIGYADGYRRELSNKAEMMVNGVRCPVVGTVCMDMTMIDVSTLGENVYCSEVEVMGDNITVTELAKLLNTIEYEILCGISTRIPRYYPPAKGG